MLMGANVNKALAAADALVVAEEDEATFNDYKGQLYAWRALLHFDLARMFCQIPTISDDINAGNTGLVLSLEVYEPGYVAPRTTLKETYDQILKDFDTAIPLLTKEANNGHINYWAALALRARANLYYGNNEAALKDANEVIACKEYSLYTYDLRIVYINIIVTSRIFGWIYSRVCTLFLIIDQTRTNIFRIRNQIFIQIAGFFKGTFSITIRRTIITNSITLCIIVGSDSQLQQRRH